jgi:predicted ATPase
MNILIGAHGAGKTTLLNEVNKFRQDVYTSDGFSRPVKEIKKHLLLDSLSEQIMINKLTLWRWNQDIHKTNCLFTRSLVDAIIYTEEMFPLLSIVDMEDVFEETYRSLNKIFYIPIEFELEGDGVRFEDKDFQKSVDRSFQSFIEDYQLPVIEIRGSIEQRLRTILKHI